MAPVPTWKGRKSFALPEFDPFWAEVERLDIVVGMHSGDAGYQRYVNEWEGIPTEMLPFKAHGLAGVPGDGVGQERRARRDGVDHRPRSRHPVPEAEVHAGGVHGRVGSARSSTRMQAAYERSPVLFDEDPFEVFKRNIYVHIFHEPDPQGLLDLGLPADRLMFGSDFPHPEGIGDPLAYSEVVEDLAAGRRRS